VEDGILLKCITEVVVPTYVIIAWHAYEVRVVRVVLLGVQADIFIS
jgi:hypothetical protein